MLSSTLPLVALFTLSNALAIDRRADVPYHYMPVDYDYGFDSRVTANFTFGTSPDAEPVQVVMDSGSANFWLWAPGAVVHYGSPYLGVTGPCNETVPTAYDPSSSSTSVVTNHSSTYAYAGNAKIVAGDLYANDSLTAVGGSGAISNVEFALENTGLIKISDDGSCKGVEYDKSILGLSPFTNTTSGPSFRENLFNTGAVVTKTMVMWFNKHTGALGRLTGGVLFGAIDTSKYTGPLVRLPSVVEDYQVGVYVPKPNITIGGNSFVLDENTTCLVDSGAHGDSLPFDYFGTELTRFFADNGAKLIDYNGVVAYNGTCDTIPADLNITYTFAGEDASESVSIDVLIRNYARGYTAPNNPEVCLLNMETGGCTFGATFLSGAFMALDDADNSIALAQGGVSEEGSGIDAASLKVFAAGESF